MTTAVVASSYSRLASLLLPDFRGTAWLVEKAPVVSMEKREVLLRGIPPSSNVQRPTGLYAYLIWVTTANGTLFMEISEEVYWLLGHGEHLIVRYRCGRRTKRLRGHIAR